MHPGLNVYKEPIEAWKTVETLEIITHILLLSSSSYA